MYNPDNIKNLFERLKTVSLWDRIFSWNKIRNQISEALADLKILTNENQQLATTKETIANLSERKRELEIGNAQQEQELKNIRVELNKLELANASLLKDEGFRKEQHSNSITALNQIREQIQSDRIKELEERSRAELQRMEGLKETWYKHEEDVKNIIKTICSKHTIEYVEKVPFKGNPDNTLKICDEFVIFDAKSPASDDLTNFHTYLKKQTEEIKKYTKEEFVKKDVFLVVPSNTLENITQFVFRLADYTVFIISIDALEPVILSLQKIEDYEFAEQLSPEERENICRVLGKFAHLTKRRIQIDTFFIKQFMELAYKAESDLPPDILDKVVEFEKAEKLNPPLERRAKQISLKELEKDTTKLSNETFAKGIATAEEGISTELNKLPLYNEDATAE